MLHPTIPPQNLHLLQSDSLKDIATKPCSFILPSL
jgi:hypothetical protein